MKPIITLTTDFQVQSQGIGAMEAVIAEIAPDTRVIHLMHGLPDFDIRAAARTMETVQFIPVGIHVCVVDPGVGTARKGIIIQTKRGDYFIGPDNGIFPSAVKLLGGAQTITTIENPTYMHHPVSPIFHGRDVFAPAAAHLSCGVALHEFGTLIPFESLVSSPYREAEIQDHSLLAEVIHKNKFGSLHLNILAATWDRFGVKKDEAVTLSFPSKTVTVPYVTTFGEVLHGEPLIMKDDYGRVEVAINMGSFCEVNSISVGDTCTITKTN